MVELTILRDTREKKPWDFENFPVECQDVTLDTGDYTIEEFCDYDSDNDTFQPSYAIERKSGDDFISSITHNMSRFQQEMKRAGDWESPLLVVVEEPKTPSRYQNSHFLHFHDVSREQVYTTVDTLERNYNVSFRFAGDRGRAQQITYSTLLSQLRSRLTSEG